MSEVKVNKISPRTNCGTVQLGDSGDTITIPAGATITNSGTQTGFGRTGAVDWQTSIKTGDFTAASGEGYFIDTSSGAITVTLPASPSAGAIVAVSDYAKTFDTNKVTLVQNGSDKIGGSTINGTLQTEGIAVTLVFIDSTQGWLVTDSGLQDEAPTAAYIAATGGTVTTVCTNFKVHTFTGPGTFCVSAVGNAAGSNTVDYLVVAGGGSGGGRYAGGGGAGGFRESSGSVTCYSSSPLGSSVSALPVTATGFPITVGAGGANVPASPGTARGNRGSTSTFSSITSTGGGGGGGQNQPENPTYMPGGSGGGNSYNSPSVPLTSGTGNTPPVSPPQGQSGGVGYPGGSPYSTGGGGGATEAGVNAASNASGRGGAGASTGITGSSVAYAGGGGGSASNDPNSPGAASPCGTGGNGGSAPSNAGGAGSTNKGGGGGGAYHPSSSDSGAGGSGVVIIRYKFQ